MSDKPWIVHYHYENVGIEKLEESKKMLKILLKETGGLILMERIYRDIFDEYCKEELICCGCLRELTHESKIDCWLCERYYCYGCCLFDIDVCLDCHHKDKKEK
jgi:hypothetical protein